MARTRDLYQVLGVAPDASQQEIQRAYRRHARRYHPDVNSAPDAVQRFKEISEAYQVLSDPDRRARYDGRTGAGRLVSGWPVGWAAPGASGGRRIRVRTGGLFPRDPDDPMPEAYAFRAGGFGGPAGVRGDVTVELTVEEAYLGGRRRITLPRRGGPRTYDITFPPGAGDGDRIRIEGVAGSDGHGGDLVLAVRLAPHDRYRVDGRDVMVDLPVSPWEAALGATVPVETPVATAMVALPAGSSTGRLLRLAGRGLPNPDGPAGDLYAEVKIVVPERPTGAERELFQRLADCSRFDPRGRDATR